MGAMDLQHIQYRELGKGLQVWAGKNVGRKIARERTDPASDPSAPVKHAGRKKTRFAQGRRRPLQKLV